MCNPAKSDEETSELTPRVKTLHKALANRSIVLIGMMGSGKSSIGRRLATALSLRFFDADYEIEHAAGMPIEEIFNKHGEDHFREGEKKVIKRLLSGSTYVIATGGGAVISPETRAEITEKGISIWLNAPLDLLFQRVSRRDNRPLLKTENPKQVLSTLLERRVPFYSEANLVVESRDAPHAIIVEDIIVALETYLQNMQPIKMDGADEYRA